MGYLDRIEESDVLDGLSIRFLKIFGVWKAINDYRATGKKSVLVFFHCVVTLSMTVPYMIYQIQSFFNIQFDLTKLTLITLHSLPSFTLVSRIVLVWLQMDRFFRLYDMIKKDFIKIPEYMRDRVRNSYYKRHKMLNLTTVFVFFWNACAVFIYLYFPTIPIDYINNHTGSMAAVKTGRKKILAGWFPCPMDEYPYYEILFVYESMCMFWFATFLNVYFCMLYQVLMCLYTQYIMLAARLSNLKIDFSKDVSSGAQKTGTRYSNTNVYDELYESLQDHQKLLRYTNELRKFYNPLVTITLGIGALIMLMGSVQISLGKTSDTSFLFQLLQIFSFEFIEVSLLCYGSSLIETATSELDFAVYSSDWYKAETKFRRDAQMLMIRTRRSSTLTAIVMYPVNLETLGAIVQFTYSATALMSGMID